MYVILYIISLKSDIDKTSTDANHHVYIQQVSENE